MSYVPHTADDRREMLRVIGVETVADLFAPIPDGVRLDRALAVPEAADEASLLRHLRELAGRNANADTHTSFLGAGIYDHFTPAIVDALISRGEFLTAYTPYQPELSQGMLQALYEYQTLVCDLTAMDLANASMYDAATAIAEGALMACGITGRKTVVVSRAVHPHYRQVLATYARAADLCVREIAAPDGVTDASGAGGLDDVASVVVQHPNFFGCLEDLAVAGAAAHRGGALLLACVDPVSLGVLKPPGELGADIVVGEGQGLGCPMGFGGPLLGFFACRAEFQRRFPGRIVGATVDGEGRRGYTMTLRTREQDIRREKATSNICTNESLLALAATVHLCAMGKQGLREVAEGCAHRSHYAVRELEARAGVAPRFVSRFFKEVAMRLPHGTPPGDLNRSLLRRGIIGGYDLGRSYPELAGSTLLCFTETKTRSDIDRLVDAIAETVG